MSTNNFIQPLFDFPNSCIFNEIERKSYTYQEFYNKILNVESELKDLDIKKNSIVVIYAYRNSFHSLLLFFFCIKNDLIPFIVEQGNLSSVDDLNFNILITPKALESREEVKIKEFEFGEVYKNSQQKIYVGNSNNFAVVSSSGSTSKITKKILLGKKETINNIKSNQEALELSKDDTTLVLLPISYSYGLIAQFFSHFLLGADIILSDKTLGILQITSLLKKYPITNIFMTPLMSRLLFNYNKNINKDKVKNNLNFITLGGDKANKDGVKKLQNIFQCPIYSTYGLAEAGPRVATKKLNLNETLSLDLGIANPAIKMEIIKNEKYQKLYGADEVGYLRVETPSIYLGYIVGNTVQKPIHSSTLKTKDVCIKDNNGIHLLGRDEHYTIKNDKIIWFYDIGNNFYKNPNVLKVNIKKEIDSKLNITVYHRNQIVTDDFSDVLYSKYGLTKNSEYTMNLVEFNSSQYK